MSLGVLHLVDADRLLLSSARIERGVFRQLKSCEDLLGAAQAAATAITQAAEASAADKHAEAHMQGYERGRSDGMLSVLSTLEVERRLRELLSDRLAALVEHCVRSILADFGPDEVFRRRVLQLIRAGAPGGASKLHVCPTQTGAVHKLLAEQAQTSGVDLSWLTVLSDEACAPDTLVLETQVGFVDASLELTLAGVSDIIGKAVQRAAAELPL
ncbi:MAG: type III secretion system stator protein SctL [Rubrivivax sp.]|nr:type III secretion system stator protein SctL [Rubrivivax sp.]